MTTTTKQQEQFDASDLTDSLTGYDEDAIEKAFGAELAALEGARFLRALLFGHYRHEGQTDTEALKAAKSLTLKQVNELFKASDEFPDLPGSESGKGDS